MASAAELLERLKKKATLIRSKSQHLQSQLRSISDEMIHSKINEPRTHDSASFVRRIDALFADYSLEINRLEMDYLRCWEAPSKHSKRTDFACLHCGRRFRMKRWLSAHLRSAHNADPYACGDCAQTFRFQRELAAHARRGCRPNKEHACAVCGKRFRTRDALKQHAVQAHTVAATFACDYVGCRRSFKLKKYLFHHIRHDHDGRPWQCRDCDASFKQKAQLVQHAKTAHAGARPRPMESSSAPKRAVRAEAWHCQICTLRNDAKALRCSLCDTLRPRKRR